MRYGLKDEIWKEIFYVLGQFPGVHSAVLYGSRAMGKERPASDIDITLLGDGLDLQTLHHIATALDDLDLPYQFDISAYDQIENESLRDHIARVGIPVYERG